MTQYRAKTESPAAARLRAARDDFRRAPTLANAVEYLTTSCTAWGAGLLSAEDHQASSREVRRWTDGFCRPDPEPEDLPALLRAQADRLEEGDHAHVCELNRAAARAIEGLLAEAAGASPADPDGLNRERAERAAAAVEAFARHAGCDPDEAFAVLLCDMMHLADSVGRPFGADLERAREYHAAETGR